MEDSFHQKPPLYVEYGEFNSLKKCSLAVLLFFTFSALYICQIKYQDIIGSTETVIQVKNISSASSNVNIELTSSTPVLVEELLTLKDVFISVKSTRKFYEKRLKIILDTWIQNAVNQTYIFTDEDNENLSERLPEGHVINTNCHSSHSRIDLCCKFAKEYNHFIKSGKSWFCHVDDDNYLNVNQLLAMLRTYDPSELWYLGKPSLDYPLTPQRSELKDVKFWFATLGAGVCLSKALATEMTEHAGDYRFSNTCDNIGMPDDCTLGYIVNYLLGVNLTIIKQFHSHLEILKDLKDPENQVTLSFAESNVITIEGFDVTDDPTRLKSLHCKLQPEAEIDYCSALRHNRTE